MSEEELIAMIEAESARKTEAVRAMLLEQGRPDLAAELDANLKDIRLGLTTARSCWHSISRAQRRLLLILEPRRRLVRRERPRTMYDALGEPGNLAKVAGLATARNLAARELLAWDGGAFDPEAAAVLTERGRFVIKHGPTSPPV